MTNSVSVQTMQFLYSALFGIALGVLFDIVRLIRSYIPGKRLLTALADFLFWCVATVSLLGFVLTVCDGRMRWYVLMGVFCGCFVYMAALSEIVYKVISGVVFLVRKLLYFTTRPVYLLLRLIWRGIKRVGRQFERSVGEKAEKRMKKERAGKNGGKKKKKAQEHIP